MGRLTKEKGADDLLKIINSINATKYGENVQWNIAGAGEFKKQIVQLQEKWSNVSYLGYIPNDYIAYVYKKNDIFISTSKFESFPYSFLEALSFGLPIISYNIHGCNEIVVNNVNGFLVPDINKFIYQLTLVIRNNPFSRPFIKLHAQNKFKKKVLYEKLYRLLTNNEI